LLLWCLSPSPGIRWRCWRRRGVAKEHVGPAGRIGVARDVVTERQESTGGVVLARVAGDEGIDSVGGALVARGVAKERLVSDGGVEATSGVALKRSCPQTGVALRQSNPRQRERENERCNKDGEKRSSVGRMAKHINPPVFRVLDQQKACIIETLKSQRQDRRNSKARNAKLERRERGDQL
jgi:hypothetical protein